MGEDAPHEAAVVLVPIQMAFFLGRVSGSSFQQPPALSASCCEGAVSRYAAVMPTTVQSDSGKRERSSATSNFDGRHHGSGAGRRRRGPHNPRRQPDKLERELHPVLVLIVRSRARQQDLGCSRPRSLPRCAWPGPRCSRCWGEPSSLTARRPWGPGSALLWRPPPRRPLRRPESALLSAAPRLPP